MCSFFFDSLSITLPSGLSVIKEECFLSCIYFIRETLSKLENTELFRIRCLFLNCIVVIYDESIL